jgi:hypothetical protein
MGTLTTLWVRPLESSAPTEDFLFPLLADLADRSPDIPALRTVVTVVAVTAVAAEAPAAFPGAFVKDG